MKVRQRPHSRSDTPVIVPSVNRSSRPRTTDLAAPAGSIQEPHVDTCWSAIVPTSLDVLGASLFELKQSTREMERIAARLAAGDAVD